MLSSGSCFHHLCLPPHVPAPRVTWCLMPAAPGWPGRSSSSCRVSAGARGREGGQEAAEGWAGLGHRLGEELGGCLPTPALLFELVHQAFT